MPSRTMKHCCCSPVAMAARVSEVTAAARFTWAVREEILPSNPCKLVARNAVRSRERVLADSELPMFWKAFGDAGLVVGAALKMILLTGQRPGEVAHMRREHIKDGWWEIPGEPVPTLGWPGTKNGESHRVWLPAAARELLVDLADDASTGFVFAGSRGRAVAKLDEAMRTICAKLGAERATPHDLVVVGPSRHVVLPYTFLALHMSPAWEFSSSRHCGRCLPRTARR